MWDILRRLRDAKGLSRAEVGEALNVGEPSVWRWEQPRTSGGCIPELERLPDILDLYEADDAARESVARALRITRAHPPRLSTSGTTSTPSDKKLAHNERSHSVVVTA